MSSPCVPSEQLGHLCDAAADIYLAMRMLHAMQLPPAADADRMAISNRLLDATVSLERAGVPIPREPREGDVQ